MTKLNGLCVGMLAGGAVVLAGACQNRDTGAVTSKASEAVEHRDMALVRVVNAVPGGKPVSIWAGDSAAFGSVAYGRTTSYREIPDDMFTFQIKSDTGTEPLAQNRENLHDGGHYTIVAYPTRAAPKSGTSGSWTTTSSRSRPRRRASGSSTACPATPTWTSTSTAARTRCSTA